MSESPTGKWLTWTAAGYYSLSQKPSDDIEFWNYAWDEDLVTEDSVYFDSKEEAEAAGFIVG